MGLKQWKDILRSSSTRGVAYPHQLAFLLELPFRKLILSPKRLVERLHLHKDMRVPEVGPGPGLFSVEVARRLPLGHLQLFDLQREMLNKARGRLQKAGVRNAGFTQGDAASLPYCDNAFDVVFLVTVLGEVADTVACLRSIYRSLRPGGLLSITEQRGDPDYLSLSEVRAMAEQQGFEFTETYEGWRHYTANFRKPTPHSRPAG